MITKIIIPSSGIIDLKEDVPLSFNYNIADIRQPDKKHGNFSKTITIPGSQNNDKMFMHIFEIGIDRQFNPNKKAKVMVMVAETLVFRGYLRLLKINKLRDKLEYEVTITGKLSNIFTDLKDKKLNDLNWDDLDHTYSKAVQKASWTAAVGAKYIYGFIDYGFTLNEIDYNVNHFFPGIYLKEFIDRIFKEAGYQYTSTFFTGDFFKRLFIPFTGDKFLYTATEINTRRLQTSRKTTTQSNTVTAVGPSGVNNFTIIFNDDSTSPNEDTANQYNTATGEWTIGKTGNYQVVTNIIFHVELIRSTPASPQTNAIAGNIEIFNVTTSQVLASSSLPGNFFTGYLPHDDAYGYCGNVPSDRTGASFTRQVQTNGSILLQAGQKIIIRHNIFKVPYYGVSCGTADTNTYNIITEIDSSFYNIIDPNIKDGDSVVVKDLISSDIKQSTFLAAIMQMFNLYTETDPDNDTILLIEPRKDFYNSTVIDWSDLLDESQDLVIEPMGALDDKSYAFTYKKDDDYMNDFHFKGHGHTYGRMRVEVDNDFLKSEKVIESIFSASPQASSPYSRDFPRIINIDKDGNIVRKKNNLRLLYFSGTVTLPAWAYWQFQSGINGVTTETTYPHCGHIDSSSAPTIDLSFGVPTEVYYQIAFGATYTNNNLYNVYWRTEIEEITDKNSSMVTGWFRLRAADIFALDFRKLYVFKNQQFRLNKVIDYNPTAEGLTKCEFIKVKLAKPFLATSVGLLGSSDIVFEASDTTSLTPGIRFPETPGGNSPSRQERNLIIGSNNKVSEKAMGVLVVGSDNFVGDDAQNITILNSSGVIVSGGLQNVDVRNSSGVIINDSNTSIIGQPLVLGRPSEFAAIGFAAKADSSAFMDIRSTSKGFLMPRMSKAQKDAIVTPANGLIVYQTDAPIGLQYYQGDGATWRQMVNTADLDAYALLAGRSGGQTIIGGTDAGNDLILIATSNATNGEIIFQSNPTTERARILSTGELLINKTALTLNEKLSLTHAQIGSATNSAQYIKVNTSGTATGGYFNGLYVDMAAGYTGGVFTSALVFDNQIAGTHSSYNSDTSQYGYRLGGNRGVGGYSRAVTVGHNVGGLFLVGGGNVNYGIWAAATITKNSATNVGVFGSGLNGGTTPIQVGGYFTLYNAAAAPPINISAALICDNGTQTSNIFVARDNGNIVLSLIDGGNMFLGGSTSPTAKLHIAAGTATANTAPLKLTSSGTGVIGLLSTAEKGALEFSDYGLWFTPATTRHTVLTTPSANVVSPTSPNRTITVNIDGTTYYIHAKTTND